ncbi:hypothetical protein GU926_03055 [Nibribacter ruber]|uniref:Outer membrane beta-barrel protein n=1 Tax=Nibribacter ruber TaxID=2698458 RepID=A0A6P1NVX4_9BACT|nr:hypothetical protein [Nibribacter ruber]QHL86474.1 hypothetical protein GU926_03055 [Nibribacter ruber]
MKRIYCLLVLFLVVSVAHAQENRGRLLKAKIIRNSLMVGGGLNGTFRSIENHTSTSTSSSTKFQVDAQGRFGYFLLNDVAVGVLGTISHSKIKAEGSTSIPTTHVLLGPFVRYYLDNGIFGEASYSLGIKNLSGTSKKDLSEIRGAIGYAWFLSPKIAIEPSLVYTYYKEKNPADADNYFTEMGPSINIALQVYLFSERSNRK